MAAQAPASDTSGQADQISKKLQADEALLRAQGHVEEMPRQFSHLAAIGLAFSITNSWVAISAVFQQPLTAGGGPGVIYSLLIASVACLSSVSIYWWTRLIMAVDQLTDWNFSPAAGLAELASAFPTSGGQYHFAFVLATENTRAATAFVTGWLSVIGWILCTAASAIYAGSLLRLSGAALRNHSSLTICSPDNRLPSRSLSRRLQPNAVADLVDIRRNYDILHSCPDIPTHTLASSRKRAFLCEHFGLHGLLHRPPIYFKDQESAEARVCGSKQPVWMVRRVGIHARLRHGDVRVYRHRQYHPRRRGKRPTSKLPLCYDPRLVY